MEERRDGLGVVDGGLGSDDAKADFRWVAFASRRARRPAAVASVTESSLRARDAHPLGAEPREILRDRDASCFGEVTHVHVSAR